MVCFSFKFGLEVCLGVGVVGLYELGVVFGLLFYFEWQKCVCFMIILQDLVFEVGDVFWFLFVVILFERFKCWLWLFGFDSFYVNLGVFSVSFFVLFKLQCCKSFLVKQLQVEDVQECVVLVVGSFGFVGGSFVCEFFLIYCGFCLGGFDYGVGDGLGFVFGGLGLVKDWWLEEWCCFIVFLFVGVIEGSVFSVDLLFLQFFCFIDECFLGIGFIVGCDLLLFFLVFVLKLLVSGLSFGFLGFIFIYLFIGKFLDFSLFLVFVLVV